MSEPAGGTEFASRRRNRGNIRRRPRDDESDGDAGDDDTEVVRKAKVAKAAPLAFSTKQEGRGSAKLMYEGSRSMQGGSDQGATRMLETETETDRDGRALRERVLAQGGGEAPADDGLYRGMTGYTDHRKGFRREHTIGAEKGGGAHGPLRAASNVRMTVRFDYQPDICKDYKETGYCGYGDACKFIHDRGDYKSGWELDREWNERQKRVEEAKWRDGDESEGGDSSEPDDDIPFACYICRKPWGEAADPVVTKCKHYFCTPCALRHSALNKGRCAACEQQTGGIFNVAHDVLKRQKEAARKEAAEAADEG